jgi:Bacterial regulatory helix-turn-helix protein, lysR family
MIFSDRFPLMSSSKCCIALHVQGLFHIARCKSGIVPHAEALEDYSEVTTDSALRVVDLDLRLVGYFAAVAEHRHFGRAGAALRVAQPSLSRQIRRLEQQIGIRLFDRTPQSTRLTEAGEVFLPRAKALLQLDVAVLPGRRLLGCG